MGPAKATVLGTAVPLRQRRVAVAPRVAQEATPAHAEITVGRDAKNRLVARFDAARSYPLEASRLIGIDGYAAGFPGFNSIFEERAGDAFFQLDPASSIEFVLVGADPGIAVWNDHGTGPMAVEETFLLGAPPFDAHAVWNCTRGEAGKRYALRLKLRDRTGRYGDSDVFSPGFTPDDSTELYACPMKCNGGTTTHAALGPVCGMLPIGWRAATRSRPRRRRGGRRSHARFELAAPDGGAAGPPGRARKLIHLLMVSSDLAWFAHEHPALEPDGSFTLRTTFPHGGTYTLFHDFTSKRDGMQVVPVELAVAGEVPAPVALLPTPTGHASSKAAGDTRRARAAALPLQPLAPGPRRAGREAGHRPRALPRRARPPHRDQRGPPPLRPQPSARRAAEGGQIGGTRSHLQRALPLPRPLQAWVQLQRHGRVLTAPFVFDVVRP
jgi:hypothetical protein